MGTLLDKLNHLKQTKEAIKNALVKKGVTVSDTDTFLSYADKMNSVEIVDHAISAIVPEKEYRPGTYTDELGDVAVPIMFIFPKYKHHSSYKVRSRLLVSCYNEYSGYNIASSVNYADFSQIEVPSNRYVKFTNDVIYGVSLSRLVLPDKVYLGPNAFGYSRISSSGVVAIGVVAEVFSNLIFRGNVYSCSSSWLRSTEAGADIRVFIPKNFTGTVYLSKACMSADTMLNMFENLADLTDTGKSYTLNIGDTNKAKLTDEQILIATNKGWTIT